ncbi:hypothetical protein JAO29_15470 [Edaphobacter sp. HDX4]|uniref:hypothetical protein n=1 Tax=Edaphobacter sp. HDX4 TaxID=2794064 RepID=UPI002FE52C81
MARARAVRKDNSEMLDQIADGVKIKRKRTPKAPPAPPELKIIPPDDSIDRWLVLGLDPSLSRTGYAFMLVENGPSGQTARWLDVGSLKPDDASVPVWIRSKAIALTLKRMLDQVVASLARSEHHLDSLKRTGLIISLEAPTPGNDFLTSISRILHLVLLDSSSLLTDFGRTQVQMTNASTLRSLMGLKKTGNKNKVENVGKAYEYLDLGKYHNLDTDACDAVLMAIMGRYSAAILLGIPRTFLSGSSSL